MTVIEFFKNRPCTLHYTNPGYVPPSVEELKAFAALTGLKPIQMAKITGSKFQFHKNENFNPDPDIHWSKKGFIKNSPYVTRWFRDPGDPLYRQISYSDWRLLLIYAGIVDLDDERNIAI